MEITLPISSLVIIAIGAIGVAVSIVTSLVFFYRKRSQHISNVLLSLLLFLIGLTFLNDTLTTSGVSNRFKDLYFIPLYYALSIGPLFYLFVKSKYYNTLSKVDYLHLAIPLVQALFYMTIGFRSIEYKTGLWASPMFQTYFTVESLLFTVSLIFYSLLSRMLLTKTDDPKYFWSNDLKNWLTQLTNVFLFVAAIELMITIGEFFLNYRFGSVFYIARFLIFVGFICWMAYNVIKLLYPATIYNTTPKRAAVLLNGDEVGQMKTELHRLITEEKIYLNSDLTLSILSEYLATTEKKCSNLLSTELNTNFNQFINAYRIESFKEKIKEGKHKEFTLLTLAYESGFESKSTFNRHFKLLNSMTPSQFIQSQEKFS